MAKGCHRMFFCLTALMGFAGCADQLSSQGHQQLMTAYAASNAGDDKAVIVGIDEFLKDKNNQRSDRAAEAYYLRGLSKYRLDDRDGATADFQEALSRTGIRQVRGKAALALGDLAWDRDDMPAAENMYAKALENLDRGVRPADHVYYRLGCVLQRLGRWQDADRQFSMLAEFFAGSELAVRGGRRMHARDWAIQIGAFAGKARAEEVANELSAKNLSATVAPVVSDERLVFVVLVGHYRTYEDASSALVNIKTFESDAFVITTR